MFNHLPTTGKQHLKTHHKTFSKSESQATERSESIKSLNYKRKSSRDLLGKIRNKESQEKGYKLVLQESMFKQPLIKTERLKQKVSQRLENTNKVKTKTIINIPNKKIQYSRQSKPPSKPLFFQKYQLDPQPIIQTQALMKLLIKQFEQICQDKFAKLYDKISYFCFQQTIRKISGVHYLNITKPIWDELFQSRNSSWLSVLSFLLALFHENFDKYYQDINPTITATQSSQNQFHQKSESTQKRKIIIKKSFSKTKENPMKIGQYSNSKSYFIFTSEQMHQLSSKYSYLKTQIMNKLKQQVFNQKQNKQQQVIVKVHIKNQLTSMKINRYQDPIAIAKKFATQQKLDSILENKLCYFLSKELKNI